MHPVLDGEHLHVVCHECQFPFQVELASASKRKHFVCPNCGCESNLAVKAERVPPEKLLVQPSSGPWNRWDLVCFHERDSSKLLVKRVAGLPGETIELRDGSVHVNGAPVFLWDPGALIDVFDSKWQPPESDLVPNRLLPERDGSCWVRVGNSFQFTENGATESALFNEQSGLESAALGDRWDWLTYRHWRCFAQHGSRFVEYPINDNYGYNQSLSRKMNIVSDLVITANLSCSKDAMLRVKTSAWPGMRLEVDRREGICRVWSASNQFKPKTTPLVNLKNDRLILVVSTLGGERDLKIGGRSVIRVPNLGRPDWTQSDGKQREADELKPRYFDLAGGRGEVLLERLTIGRAIYYFAKGVHGSNRVTRKAVSEEGQQFSLADDEYFLLGDNVPVSRDSRHFEPAGIGRANIIGRVETVGR